MQHKVSEVISYSEQTYGKWGSHRSEIKIEGNDQKLSVFVKSPLTVGQVIDGEVKKVEKDGKVFWNFEFTKKGEASNESLKDLQSDVNTLLNNQVRDHILLQQILACVKPKEKHTGIDYPENNLDEAFSDEDQPF